MVIDPRNYLTIQIVAQTMANTASHANILDPYNVGASNSDREENMRDCLAELAGLMGMEVNDCKREERE